jgi:hypothetical protein
MHRALVSQINVRANRKTLGILIRQDDGARSARLAHDICCSWVVKEAVVNTARVPSVHTLGTTERGITDERVATTVIVTSIVVSTVVVLL